MQLREIMMTDMEVIRPDTSVSQAAQKMRSIGVGALPVCEGKRLVGMVTDRNKSAMPQLRQASLLDSKSKCCLGEEKLGVRSLKSLQMPGSTVNHARASI
jgi:predicted transcriptional regulator